MKPLALASHFEAFCRVWCPEKGNCDVPAAGAARLGAPRKTPSDLSYASELRIDDWGACRLSERTHRIGIRGSPRKDLGSIACFESGCESIR